jgi:hypothetical protein
MRFRSLASGALAINALAMAVSAHVAPASAQTRWDTIVFMATDKEIAISREFTEWTATFYISNRTGQSLCVDVHPEPHGTKPERLVLLKPYQQRVSAYFYRVVRALSDPNVNAPWSMDIRLVAFAAKGDVCRHDDAMLPNRGRVWDAGGRPGQVYREGRGWGPP